MTETWKTVLANADFPIRCITIDFESYVSGDYSLAKLSTLEYILHPQWEVLGVALFEFEQPFIEPHAVYIQQPDIAVRLKRLQEEYGDNFDKVTVIVQNSFFDCAVLKYHYNINPKYVVDMKWLANHFDARASSALKNLAKRYKCSTLKGNTKQFFNKHFTEIDQGEIADYSCNDANIETELFMKLLPGLTNPVIELQIMQHTLKLFLDPVFKFDFALAKKLINKMTEARIENVNKTDYTEDDISGNISFAEILTINLPEEEHIPVKVGKPTKNMIKYTGEGFIPALAKTDDGVQQLLKHPDPNIRTLIQARLDLKSWSGHIKRIRNMANIARVCGGKLPIPLHYYGGRTGRDSGTEGINPQNFGGKGRGVALNPLIGMVRQLLVAPRGYILGITDAAQIEARVLAWFAGEDKLVKGFAAGEDIYSEFASTLFGMKVYKCDDPDLKIKRGFGKDGILGCGYGMGSAKFYSRCLENPVLKPLFIEGVYNRIFIDRLIKTYRETYRNIPKFWGQCEKAFRWVLKYPYQVVDLFDKGCPAHLIFAAKGSIVTIQLPSERKLFYYHCKLKDDGIREHYGPLWGGAIAENIIQAVSRDIFMDACLIADKKYPVILRVHDEMVNLIPENQADKGLEYCIDVMKTPPNWVQGLPLNADGNLSKVYNK